MYALRKILRMIPCVFGRHRYESDDCCTRCRMMRPVIAILDEKEDKFDEWLANHSREALKSSFEEDGYGTGNDV